MRYSPWPICVGLSGSSPSVSSQRSAPPLDVSPLGWSQRSASSPAVVAAVHVVAVTVAAVGVVPAVVAAVHVVAVTVAAVGVVPAVVAAVHVVAVTVAAVGVVPAVVAAVHVVAVTVAAVGVVPAVVAAVHVVAVHVVAPPAVAVGLVAAVHAAVHDDRGPLVRALVTRRVRRVSAGSGAAAYTGVGVRNIAPSRSHTVGRGCAACGAITFCPRYAGVLVWNNPITCPPSSTNSRNARSASSEKARIRAWF